MRSKRSRVVAALAALLALNALLLVVQPAAALPNSLAAYFFGPKMVRAEVLVQDGGVLHDYRIDRGVIRSRDGDSLTLLERDGSIVTIQVSPAAAVTFNGRPIPFAKLRKRMHVTVIRDGDAPAIEVRAGAR
jgi:hypothetical protein